MAKSRLYKIVNVATKNMGSSGSQVLLGQIDKLDAQGVNGYLNNVRVSVLIDEAEQDTIGFLAYLTTDDAWNDDYVISAGAGGVGKTISLSGKRTIRTNADSIGITPLSNDGPVYLWLEISDTVGVENIRYVAETWGRFIEYTER